jgi:hypothetical protein
MEGEHKSGNYYTTYHFTALNLYNRFILFLNVDININLTNVGFCVCSLSFTVIYSDACIAVPDLNEFS